MAELKRTPTDFNRDKPKLALLSDLPLQLDHEQGAVDAELFNLKARLKPVYEAICNPDLRTPFAVMITGGWGSGKTSSMRWLDRQFKLWNLNGEGREEVQVDTTWFYPWKYQDKDDVWRGLIAQVIIASMDFENVDTRKVIKAAKQFGKFLGKGFVRAISSLKLNAKTGIPGGAEVGAEFDGKELAGIIDDWSQTITPEKAYFNDFEEAFGSWIKDCYSDKKRLCIFIDDLDRCMPDIALQVLEALKLYLNNKNLVFVVGVDKQVIEKIVIRRYEEMVGEKRVKEDKFEDKAKQYLDKMFQVEANIEPDQNAVSAFVKAKLKQSAVWKSLREDEQVIEDKDLKRHISNLENALKNEAKLNPRSVVRMVNVGTMGACGDEEPLALIQSMRESFLLSICARLATDHKKQENPFLRDDGKSFFKAWSKAVCDNRPSDENAAWRCYLDESVLKRLDEEDKDKNLQPVSDIGDQRFTREAERSSEEKHLMKVARDWPEYRYLMSSVGLGLLMRFPFVGAVRESEASGRVRVVASDIPVVVKNAQMIVEEALDSIRPVLATILGVPPEEITLEMLRGTEEISLSGNEYITDAWLRDFAVALGSESSLNRLGLQVTKVTDAGLAHLKGLTSLTQIRLYGNLVGDEGLKHLKGLTSLTRLLLHSTQVGDAGLEHLKGLDSLQELFLTDTQVGNAGMAHLEGLTSLRELYLEGTQVGDTGLERLKSLTGLRVLDLSNTQVTDAGLEHLKDLTGLHALGFTRTQVGDAGLEHLKGLASLQLLALGGTQVGDAGLEHLKGLVGLQSLGLNTTQVGDAGLEHLKGLTALRELYLRGTQVTDAGVQKLRKALPNCIIRS